MFSSKLQQYVYRRCLCHSRQQRHERKNWQSPPVSVILAHHFSMLLIHQLPLSLISDILLGGQHSKKKHLMFVLLALLWIFETLFYLAFILSVRIKRFSLLVDKQVLLHREVSLWSSSCPHTHSDTTCSCQLMVQHLLLGYFTCCFDCTVILKYSSCDVWQNKLHCLNYSGLSILFSCSSSIVVVVCACCTAPKDKWTNENAGSFVWSYTGVRSSDVIINS